MWGWTAANYLDGAIQRAVETKSVANANTRGVLEMGGESLQITFVPLQEQLETFKSENLIQISLGGVMFTLFTYSYMGIGMEVMSDFFFKFYVCFFIKNVFLHNVTTKKKAKKTENNNKTHTHTRIHTYMYTYVCIWL